MSEGDANERFQRGELVTYMYDTGALGLRPLYGIVEKSGPKTATVRWQSGIRNRVAHDRRDIRRIEDAEMREEAESYLNASNIQGTK